MKEVGKEKYASRATESLIRVGTRNNVKKIGSLWLQVPSDMKNGIIRNDYMIQQQRVTDTSYSGFCWPKLQVGDTSWHITRHQKRNVKGRTLHDILHEQQVLRTHTYTYAR